jgi:predicted RNase H-like nuclease
LIIVNDEGQRLCETLVSRRYGARHASCHTSNRRLYPNAASTRLATALRAEGFVHAPEAQETPEQRIMLEVYPHAALVALFDLPCVIKYKKGTAVQKCSGLQELQRRIAVLEQYTPALRRNPVLDRVLNHDVTTLAGARRKLYEDGLDAVICAYLAYFYWVWRWERTEIFGNVESGYIVNPTLSPSAPNAVAV